MRTRLLTSLVVLAAGSTLTACGSGSGSGSGDTINIGYPSETANYADLYVCEDAGIFKKNGLNVKLTLLKTSSQLLAAITSNSVQIAGGDGNAIAAGAVKGAKVKVIAMKLPVYFVEMWGDSSIKTVDDLVGKKVGVTAPGSVTDRATRQLLADDDVSDVKLSNLTDLSALLSAGKSGSVDALVTAPPQGKLSEKWGWHKVTDMTNIKTAASVYTVSESYAKEHPDVVKKFVKSEVDCLAYLQKNRDATIKAIAKHTKASTDLAAYSYDFFKKILLTDPTVDESLLQKDFDEAAGSSKAPDAAKFVDNSYVDKLKKSGYLDKADGS